MKIFFIKALYLLLPILLILVYVEYNLGKIQNVYNYKRNCLEAQLDSIEVLVLGSSESFNGINPEYFTLHGYNAGNFSQTFYYDKQIALKYVKKIPKLKYVIIPVSYFSFNAQLVDGNEAWRSYYYFQYWGIDFPELDRYDSKRYSKILLYTPLKALTYILKGFNVNLVKGMTRNGFLPLDTTNNNIYINDSLGFKKVKTHEKYICESRFKENNHELQSLVTELKKHNITPILITLPVLNTYYKFVNKDILKRNHDWIISICEEYEILYFDYFTDSRFVQRDFHDNNHMNFIGASKFSKIVNDEILNHQNLKKQ